MLTPDEVRNRLGYHHPVVADPEAVNTEEPHSTALHRHLRVMFQDLMLRLDASLPEGRPKSVCFTEFETMAMWAHKAVASLDPVDDEN